MPIRTYRDLDMFREAYDAALELSRLTRSCVALLISYGLALAPRAVIPRRSSPISATISWRCAETGRIGDDEVRFADSDGVPVMMTGMLGETGIYRTPEIGESRRRNGGRLDNFLRRSLVTSRLRDFLTA